MNKFISTAAVAFVLLGFGSSLGAEVLKDARPMKVEKIQTMDKKMTQKRVMKKRFRNQKEFQQMKQHKRSTQKRAAKRATSRGHKSYKYRDGSVDRNGHRYDNSYGYDDGYRYEQRRARIKQRGYRNSKRGWYLAYRYDRAIFNDRYGYHYGYFNQNGYYFEGVFYGYDRDYRYSDRVRGRGVFDNRYYMPSNYNYYGFSTPRPTRPTRPYRY